MGQHAHSTSCKFPGFEVASKQVLVQKREESGSINSRSSSGALPSGPSSWPGLLSAATSFSLAISRGSPGVPVHEHRSDPAALADIVLPGPLLKQSPLLQTTAVGKTPSHADILWLAFSYLGCSLLLHVSVICGV